MDIIFLPNYFLVKVKIVYINFFLVNSVEIKMKNVLKIL